MAGDVIQSAGGTGTGSVVVTLAAPARAGSLLVGIVSRASTGALTAPTNWSNGPSQTGTPDGYLDYRVSDGTDGDTFTWTPLAGSPVMHAKIAELRGPWFPQATVLDEQGVATDSTVTSLAVSTAGATDHPQEVAVAGVLLGNSSGGADAWTESFVLVSGAGNRAIGGTKRLTAIGTPSTTASWTTAREARGVIATFRLRLPRTLAAVGVG